MQEKHWKILFDFVFLFLYPMYYTPTFYTGASEKTQLITQVQQLP